MNNYKATPGQWIDIEFCDKDDFRSAGIKELRSRIEQLEAQANHIGDSNKMVPPSVATGDNKKPAVINAVMDGDPPAPHEEWEDWVVEVFKTRTIKGVCLRAIAPGDFSFEEEEATPPPVATDEELDDIWHKRGNAPGGTFVACRRAVYNLGIEHGQAGSREMAEPAPVAGGLVERITLAIDRAPFDEGDHLWDEAHAAILEQAKWLREKGLFGAADLLKKEAGR